MIAVLALAAAAEPVLGSAGWTWFGPLPPGHSPARGTVLFEPRSCAVHVSRLLLDGGPENRDLRLLRVWTGSAWEWADDWRLDGETLRRPGRADVAAGTVPEAVEADATGAVVARVREGRRIEILREDGRFVGMRSGPVDVRLDGDRAVASDGRSATWLGALDRPSAWIDEHGVRTVLEYAGERLRTVVWADGGSVTVEEGAIVGPIGRWQCRREADRTDVVSPAGTWSVRWRDDGEAVVDPAGGVVQTRRERGRLRGWRDARSGETRLDRDEEGRIVAVTDPSGAVWQFERERGRLRAGRTPDGARWTLRPDGSGGVTAIDPVGRETSFAGDGEGRLRERREGTGLAILTRDAAGRVVAWRPAGLGEVKFVRDASGRVERITDAGGGVWAIGRNDVGQITLLADPGGARWELRRDRLGEVSGVRDPAGRLTTWMQRVDGRISLVTVAGARWDILRDSRGWPTAIRDPMGRVSGWTRDALGRALAVLRPDGSTVRVDRDAAGDVRAIDGVRVRRDAAGRPLAIEAADGRALAWDRDLAGRVVGVGAPGIGLGLVRGIDGQLRTVRIDRGPALELRRDGAGRTAAVTGAGDVTLDRDAGGRVIGLRRSRGDLRVERDARGLASRLQAGAASWRIGRDAAARIVRVEAGGEVSLGVDRDAAGRARLVRFPDGALARVSRGEGAVDVIVEDADGVVQSRAGWTEDATGRVDGVVTGATWTLRRDPLGALVTAESAEGFWSLGPDGIEGPEGAALLWNASGRPLRGRTPESAPPLWGVASGDLAYVIDDDGAIVEIAGGRGSARLRHDGLGRLTGWSAPDGDHAIVRDALGRLAEIGGIAVEGWQGLLSFGGSVRAPVDGVGVGRPGGGVVFDPRGTPLVALHAGATRSAPSGLPFDASAGESGAAGRVQALFGGPLLGLVDALDPMSGQPTGPRLTLPWSARRWEALPDGTPWPDPDTSAAVWWDDAPWAPESPWSDPLALLAEAEEFEAAGPRRRPPPGLPFLPASLAPVPPIFVPDGLTADEEPLVAWLLRHALTGASTDPAEVAALLLGQRLAAEIGQLPELSPELPPELRALPLPEGS